MGFKKESKNKVASSGNWTHNTPVFPKLYKVDNIDNKYREEHNKFSKINNASNLDGTQGFLMITLMPSWLS